MVFCVLTVSVKPGHKIGVFNARFNLAYKWSGVADTCLYYGFGANSCGGFDDCTIVVLEIVPAEVFVECSGGENINVAKGLLLKVPLDLSPSARANLIPLHTLNGHENWVACPS